MADIFTKGLLGDRFLFLCDKLGLKLSPIFYSPTATPDKLNLKSSSSAVESDLRGNVEGNNVD